MNSDRQIIFTFSGYTGIDILLSLFTKRFQVRVMAKRLLRNADPETTPIFINTPWGSWRIIDRKGRIEQCGRKYVRGVDGL